MTIQDELAPTLEFWKWRSEGACQGFPELFYHDETERKGLRRAKEHAAKQVCESCPVLEQCRDYSLSVGEFYGVWGGMTEMERHRILGRQRTG